MLLWLPLHISSSWASGLLSQLLFYKKDFFCKLSSIRMTCHGCMAAEKGNLIVERQNVSEDNITFLFLHGYAFLLNYTVQIFLIEFLILQQSASTI